MRQNPTDTGISIIGGGYLGEIPAHGNVRLQLEVQKGQYLLPYQNMPNFIQLKANYVSFDPDTGLPENPAKGIEGKLPLYNPSDKSVSVTIKPADGSAVKTEEFKMPEGQMTELDYLLPPPADQQLEDGAGNSVYEIVKLTLNQTATIERQAFDATLRISNGYPSYALQNVNVQVVLTDADGGVVPTSKYVLKSEGVTGINALDGTASLAAASSLVGQWQIIPMNGLGGDDPETGKKYYAKALITYYVNGKFVETSTEGVEITIFPQPQVTLNYYVPHKILSGVPFKLGVTAVNDGKGWARNLAIDSGNLEITTNQSGLLTEFKIIGGSWGSSSGEGFKLSLGDIPPQDTIDGEAKHSPIPSAATGWCAGRCMKPRPEKNLMKGSSASLPPV